VDKFELPISDEEMLRWARVNRPDTVAMVQELLRTRGAEGMKLLIAMAFDAGRWFQRSNGEVDLLGRNPYETAPTS
jgi:hypothetical protein